MHFLFIVLWSFIVYIFPIFQWYLPPSCLCASVRFFRFWTSNCDLCSKLVSHLPLLLLFCYFFCMCELLVRCCFVCFLRVFCSCLCLFMCVCIFLWMLHLFLFVCLIFVLFCWGFLFFWILFSSSLQVYK